MNQAGSLKKIIILLITISVLLFVSMYFVYAEIRSKNEKVSSVEQDLSQKNTRYDYLVSMQKLVKDIETDINKIDESIVPKSGDVGFIEKIEALAKAKNLNIQIESLNLISDPKAENSTVSTLKIKANVDGLWSNMYLFISELESLPIKIKMNRFSLKNKDEIPSDRTKMAGLGKEWRGSFEISVLEYK